MNNYTPPYIINVQNKNLVHVVINHSLTLTSFQSLLLELEEHLTDTPRVLFDFGTIARLDRELIVKMDLLILNIENNSGVVKAISYNKDFADFVVQAKIENTANLLADTLRYLKN